MVAAIGGGGDYLSMVMMGVGIFNIWSRFEKCVGWGSERLFHRFGKENGPCALYFLCQWLLT